jgi:hypothetical protein
MQQPEKECLPCWVPCWGTSAGHFLGESIALEGCLQWTTAKIACGSEILEYLGIYESDQYLSGLNVTYKY